MRRLRGLLIALAVLAISAGAVLASRALPQAAADGLGRAADAAGRTVPARPDVVPSVADEDEDAGEDADDGTAEDQDVEEDVDEAADDGTAEDADHPDNHGAIVSEAAQNETPEGWQNHGEYVSAVAHGTVKPGDPKPAGEAATTLKVKPVKSLKPDNPGKPDKPTH